MCGLLFFLRACTSYLKLKPFPKSVCTLSAEKLLYFFHDLKPLLNDSFTAYFHITRAAAIANTFISAMDTATSTATATAPRPTALSMHIAPTQAKMIAAAKMTALVVTTHTNVVALEAEVANPKH